MKKQPRKVWTIEEKQQVVAEVAAKRGEEQLRVILKRLGVAGSMYVRWAKQYGGEATAPPSTTEPKPAVGKYVHRSAAFKESVAYAYHTRAPGETMPMIAARFQVALGSIHRWAQEFPAAGGAAKNGHASAPLTPLERRQAELPLENPFRSAPPGETAPREQKQLVALKARIEFLEDQLTMLRGMVKIAIKRGLLEL